MIYFDNAATSYPKPPSVLKAVDDALKNAGNPGRSLHTPAVWSSQNIYETREKLAKFFNIEDPLRVAFTLNGTAALNFAARLCKGKILTTSMEHNSVLRPVYQRGYYDIVFADKKGNLAPERLISAITPTTGAVIMTHASNVTGNLYDIRTVGRYCRKHGIMFIVDVSQTAGAVKIDTEDMCIDVLCFTGHKGLMGMQGTGGIYISPRVKLNDLPMITGGTGTAGLSLSPPNEMPEYFEAGTPNTHGIAALSAGIDYINSVGADNILKQEQKLRKLFTEKLSKMNNVEIYGDLDGPFVGTVSFNIKGVESSKVSDFLAKKDVCLRGGYHCAALAHRTIGTEKTGTVRASFGAFNTADEIERFELGYENS